MLHTALSLKTAPTSLNLSHLRPAFLAFHFTGGIVGLPLLIVTCFRSENVPFQLDLVNFYLTCVLNSISYILLVFAKNVHDPPHLLCFTQAAMILGGAPMTALAFFLVVLKIWRTFRDPQNNRPYNGRISENAWSLITCSLPYILFIGMLLISVVLEIRAPHTLSANNGLYCTAYGVPFRRVSVPALTMIFLLLIIGFEVATGIRFYRSRKRIASSFPLAARNMSIGIVIRIALFNAYLCVSFGASVVFLFGPNSGWPYMVQAALPLVALILFATQKNVLLAWYFCLKGRKAVPSHSDGSMPTLRRPDASDSQLDMNSFSAPLDSRTH